MRFVNVTCKKSRSSRSSCPQAVRTAAGGKQKGKSAFISVHLRLKKRFLVFGCSCLWYSRLIVNPWLEKNMDSRSFDRPFDELRAGSEQVTDCGNDREGGALESRESRIETKSKKRDCFVARVCGPRVCGPRVCDPLLLAMTCAVFSVVSSKACRSQGKSCAQNDTW